MKIAESLKITINSCLTEKLKRAFSILSFKSALKRGTLTGASPTTSPKLNLKHHYFKSPRHLLSILIRRGRPYLTDNDATSACFG
jgi:hypothetical protein